MQRETTQKVIGYVRVSTLDQAEHGISLDAQEARLHERAAYMGIELVHIYRDAGISGSKGRKKRPGYDAALTSLEKGDSNGLMVVALDRFGRNGYKTFSDVLYITDKLNARLICLDLGGESVDTSTSSGRAMLAMMAILANMEREKSNERTTAALNQLKRTGKVYGPTPYGYQRRGDKLYKLKAEQDILAMITDHRAVGDSLASIVTLLNDKGLRTKQGKLWRGYTIDRILKRVESSAA